SLVHIAFACDPTQLFTLGPVISSVLSATASPHRIRFHIFTARDALTDASVQLNCYSRAIPFIWELHEFSKDMIRANITVHSRKEWRLQNAFNYARFYFAEILSDVQKVVYLDTDIIVKGDICRLHDANLRSSSTSVIAAVKRSVPLGSLLNFSNAAVKSSGLREKMHSFNAGVLLIDLESWRRKRITSTVETWLKMNSVSKLYSHGSQPPLLLVFGDSFESIPSHWNVDGVGYKKGLRASVLNEARVLHWSGQSKPWCR
ncbi:predicted protein, partial [Ostreococcus lucimarinus CCE9901]